MSTASSTPRALLTGWAWSFFGFGLVALLLGAQFLAGGLEDWREVGRLAVRDWLPWALATPPLFLLVAKYPVEREHRRRRLAGYVALGALLLALCLGWSHLLSPSREQLEALRREAYAAGTPRPAGNRPLLPRAAPPPLMMAAWVTPIYLAILGIGHALHFQRRAAERERRALAMEAGLARARLDALRMQLQPHFLFNSLNAVASLVHDAPDKADDMIVALATFLRRTLDAADEHEIPLARELEFTELYLRIERIRFGDRLVVTTRVAPEALAAHVPAFLLQPLVENAVNHGLAPDGAPAHVTLAARIEADALVLAVENTGAAGAAPVDDATGPAERIGLSNTRARLRELYGDAARMTPRRTPTGFVVEIRIPRRA